MQVIFHQHHFGKLAVGLTSMDQDREMYLRILQEEPTESDRRRFYEVSSGGISHPWEHKKYESRVAITGDYLRFCEESLNEPKARIFAMAQFQGKEIYFAYIYPWQIISYGLPDPVELAEEILELALALPQNQVLCRWIVVDKRQVPKYHRILLGRVMSIVNTAFAQGPEFFRLPKK